MSEILNNLGNIVTVIAVVIIAACSLYNTGCSGCDLNCRKCPHEKCDENDIEDKMREMC